MRTLFSGIALLFLASSALAQDFALNWKPEPEFGGFYEALLSKYYEQAGLKIQILPGGAGQPVTQMVAAKKVKFGIAAADEVILARAQGAKIVALFAVYQDDPQGFMTRSERNFKTLREVFQSEGTVALQKGLPFSLWIEKQFAPIKAKIVPYTGGISTFIRDPRFSQQCFVTSEPLAAKKEKINAKTFLLSESGFNPYLTVVIAHEDTLSAENKTVKAFLDATRKGWTAYLAHPETTNAAMQKMNSAMDLATFNEVSEVQKKFIQTKETREKGLGFMSKERWTKLYAQLVELGLVKAGMKSDDFFK